ncbi:MAG: hypothetical protein ACRCT1_09345 [Microcoleaceae cyanobacterium]
MTNVSEGKFNDASYAIVFSLARFYQIFTRLLNLFCKKEEGRGKKEEGRRKREEGSSFVKYSY